MANDQDKNSEVNNTQTEPPKEPEPSPIRVIKEDREDETKSK